MKPRMSVITLGVDDLERAVAFYRDGLGLATEGIVGREFPFGAVAFFHLEGGLRLALWPRESIAHETGLDARLPAPTAMTIGHNVNTPAKVDTAMAEAARAGATIIREAAETFFGGYGGYFQDPDGHLWEVVYNPGMLVDEDGLR